MTRIVGGKKLEQKPHVIIFIIVVMSYRRGPHYRGLNEILALEDGSY